MSDLFYNFVYSDNSSGSWIVNIIIYNRNLLKYLLILL